MITNEFRHACCPLCRTERIRKIGDIHYGQPVLFSTKEIILRSIPELWSCQHCESSFIQNVVPERLAVELYSHGVSAERWSREPFLEQKPARQIKCLRRYFGEGKRVLDIGCNTGELLDFAADLGCRTAGLEYSEESRKILEEKGHAAYASMAKVNEEFDVITAFDLVEHLYDVPAFLRACADRLKDGGFLLILTGDIGSLSALFSKTRWWYLGYPEHIVFPSKKYYSRYSGYRMQRFFHTYASKAYQESWLKVLRRTASGMLRGSYNGLPSIGPDHILAVLEK